MVYYPGFFYRIRFEIDQFVFAIFFNSILFTNFTSFPLTKRLLALTCAGCGVGERSRFKGKAQRAKALGVALEWEKRRKGEKLRNKTKELRGKAKDWGFIIRHSSFSIHQ
ncbi:MAG: hypothetical protein K9J16_04635 [Melioribacteraceae bacterium]|nr:hypothetical protein [Melioribacteraceae bacterium]MCF8355414.1 hypothetical protein [Melioribacteraceae bacterium]MCF8393256.1 hypothetical protein [Melioribacteraceae bacterium]MCF8417557.1 hypothetical protein [Melioribacteraceae bacterium]